MKTFAPLALVLAVGTAFPTWLRAADDVDPAQQIIDDLLKQERAKKDGKDEVVPKAANPVPPAVAPKPNVEIKPDAKVLPPPVDDVDPAAPTPKTARTGRPHHAALAAGNDANQVLDELMQGHQKKMADRELESLAYFLRGQQAAKAGRLADALSLVNQARKLAPENREFAAYSLSLQKELGADRQSSTAHARAKAHLAAGYTRSEQLMQSGRYREAEDLLTGVAQAALLFPATANVQFYQRLAERELEQYRAAVKAGSIVPESTNTPTKEDSGPQPVLVAPAVTAPANLRRLLRGSESQVPAWYAEQKSRLTTSMNADYRQTPLALVLEDIGAKTGTTVVLDRAVTVGHSHVNSNIDLKVSQIPAEMVLDIACVKGGFEYVITERSIVITTPAKALEYARQLPESLRYQWAMARMLFPEMNPELFAPAPPINVETPDIAAGARMDSLVPSYLRSGKALVEDIQQLLR